MQIGFVSFIGHKSDCCDGTEFGLAVNEKEVLNRGVNFYRTQNASRATVLPDGRRVIFDVYEYFAGSWRGVAATEDTETVSGLDALAGNPKSGVAKITEDEFRDSLKKKLPALSYKISAESPSSLPLPPAQAALASPAGLLAEEVKNLKPGMLPAPASTPKVFDDIESVLKIGKVKTVDFSGITATKPKARELQEAK